MFEEINIHSFYVALSLTSVAGLAMGAGALLARIGKGGGKRTVSFSLGLSAGLMVYLTFMEILPEAMSDLVSQHGEEAGGLTALLSYFAGIAAIALIDKLVPDGHCPHDRLSDTGHTGAVDAGGMQVRKGVFLALAIAIHNIPEGLAIFVSTLNGMSLALPLVVAIAIHNIPIGMAIAIPVYQSTGSMRKAVGLALLSGLAEPVGALLGGVALLPLWTPSMNGIVLSSVAGVMTYIMFDELLPNAYKEGRFHLATGGVIVGLAVMAFSLYLL